MKTSEPTNDTSNIEKILELVKVLKSDSNQSEAAAKLSKLAEKKDERLIVPLTTVVEVGNNYARYSSAELLAHYDDKRAYKSLIKALSDPDENVKSAAIRSLGEIGKIHAINPIQKCILNSKDDDFKNLGESVVKQLKDSTESRKSQKETIIPAKCIDVDGNRYKTVKIGKQLWMAENLKVTHYRNGRCIPNITAPVKWVNLGDGACCNYDNKEINAKIYGKLYNWYAVQDDDKIAPEGWHVPSEEDWRQLEKTLGMNQSFIDEDGRRGTKEGGKMKAKGTIERGTGLWYTPNRGATNKSGFSALPGGCRKWGYLAGNRGYLRGGEYEQMGHSAIFWSSSERDSNQARIRDLDHFTSAIYAVEKIWGNGYSVRCVKD